MNDYEIMPAARRDLIEIEEYVSSDSPFVAKRVIDELFAAMQTLADMPRLGHQRADISDARYRFFAVYSWLIVYIPGTHPLQIIRVVHGSRDLPDAMP